jgi:hypothetical protein
MEPTVGFMNDYAPSMKLPSSVVVQALCVSHPHFTQADGDEYMVRAFRNFCARVVAVSLASPQYPSTSKGHSANMPHALIQHKFSQNLEE